MDFTGFPFTLSFNQSPVASGLSFYRILLGFTGLCLGIYSKSIDLFVFNGFYCVLLGLVVEFMALNGEWHDGTFQTPPITGFTGFYLFFFVSGFNFDRVLLGFIELDCFYWVFLVLRDFTGFYWVSVGFIGFIFRFY